jgi:hypothetical protein
LESLEKAVVVSHISRKTSEMPRISCTQHRTRLRVRLSLKERRLKFGEPTKLHRKSGMWGTRDLFRVCENPKKRPQISPLRCAPVEMTILFESAIPCFHERSAEPQIPRLRSG